ncbi:DUF7344 domain-containing protein [Halorussus amylolyticus]|uniref:DUF7344 domain-containing protein n=1 Tax=Halorussus amylolyticus TaxID=1126242 RepID=UPI001043409A|nr:ArsR family transcriptional regulator [Halorussus amylolyticus]
MSRAKTGIDTADPREDGASHPSREAMFDLLGNARRRRVLRHLLNDSAVTLTNLSGRIAAWENDTTVHEVSSRERKQVYSSLYQTHLPRLSEHGLVEYHTDDRVVELTGDPDRLRSFLDVGDTEQRSCPRKWSRYFLWTAVVGSAVIAGHWLGTTPADSITTESLYGLLTVAFMMLSVSFVMAVEGEKLLRKIGQ